MLYNFSTEVSKKGKSVFALGYPLTNILGNEIKFTDGKISSLTGFKGNVSLYQTNTPLQPGNSGGPLFDYEGNLIGINSSGIKKDIAEDVSYSIKSIYLKTLSEAMSTKIDLPKSKRIKYMSLEDQIEILSKYTVQIKIK